MATYLQGVTDYIPQYQPFTPNLNFYDTILKTKQNQYDSNWKQLNNIYGKYFYADLTRDDNIKKKDELIKNINFNLQRVAGLDLSLQKNVDQAVQVFTPFYEDKNLMKDMAYTKNWNAEYGRGMGLQKAAEEDRQKQFWNTGIQELQFLREEFKNASADEAMTFASPTYTPYVNSTELAHDLAKKQGWNVKVSKSDGKHIYTTKNGQQIMEPLRKLFENTIGNDSRVQAVYRTQSYVNRKNYANSNAAMFDGDTEAAEMKYLQDNFNILKRQTQKYYMQLQADADAKDKEIQQIENKYNTEDLNPRQAMYLDDLKYNRDINRETLAKIQKEYGEFNKSGSSTATTSTGFENPYGDMNTLRRKVDGGVAQMLMRKDLSEAAETEAFRNYEVTMKTDAYGLEKVKNSNRRSLARLKGSIDRDNINYANYLKKEDKINKELEKAGVLERVVEDRKYKDLPNGQRLYKDKADPATYNSPALASIPEQSVKVPAIDPVTGNALYRETTVYSKADMEANITKGNKIKMGPTEASMRGEAMYGSNQAKQKEYLKALPALYEELETMVGVEGGISKEQWDMMRIVDKKGKTINARELYENFEKGDNAQQLHKAYKRIKNVANASKRHGTNPYLAGVSKNKLFNVSNSVHNDVAEFTRKKYTNWLQGQAQNRGKFENITNNVYTKPMIEAMNKGDQEAFDKEVAKYNIIDNRGVAKKLSEYNPTGDIINWVASGFGKEGKLIEADSWLGNYLGVNSNPYDFNNAMSAWNKYNEGKSVKLPKWMAKNRGMRSEGNTLFSEWSNSRVGNPLTEGGQDWATASRLILADPSADFSVGSTTKEGFADFDNTLGTAFMNKLIAFYGNGKDEKKAFDIAYTAFVKNDLGTEGLRINKLPADFIKSLKGTKEKPSIFSDEQIASIEKTGMYVALPAGSLSSLNISEPMDIDPIDEMIRNSGDEGYTFNSDNGEGSLNIKYNKDNGMFSSSVQTEVLLPPDEVENGVYFKRLNTEEGAFTNANWEQYLATMSNLFAIREKQNAETFNQFYKQDWEAKNETWNAIRQQLNNNMYDNGGDIKFSELPESATDISQGRIKE